MAQELLKAEEIGTLKRPKTPTKKKEVSMKKPIIWTVVITLSIVAAFIGTFIAGMNYANSLHAEREAAVKAVTSLKAQAPQNQ
jgi:hypothetical protein